MFEEEADDNEFEEAAGGYFHLAQLINLTIKIKRRKTLLMMTSMLLKKLLKMRSAPNAGIWFESS